MKRYDSYKPSGISWIGDIPSQWSLRRIKHIFSERKDKSITGSEIALSLTKDNGLIPSSEKINKTLESESLVGCKKIAAGEIVFNRFRARLFALASVDGVVSLDYAVYRASDVCKSYIVTLLNTDIYRDAFNRKASGIGDGFSRLYTDDLFTFYVPYPPLAEQERIVAYLSTKTSCIDAQQRERERVTAA